MMATASHLITFIVAFSLGALTGMILAGVLREGHPESRSSKARNR